MINLVRSIIDILNSFAEVVENVVTSLFTLIKHIPSYVSFLTTSIAFLPAIIVPFAVASVSVYVVYLIIGRNK